MLIERVTRGRCSPTSCATFEYSETASMTRLFCSCSDPAHQLHIIDRADAIEMDASGW